MPDRVTIEVDLQFPCDCPGFPVAAVIVSIRVLEKPQKPCFTKQPVVQWWDKDDRFNKRRKRGKIDFGKLVEPSDIGDEVDVAEELLEQTVVVGENPRHETKLFEIIATAKMSMITAPNDCPK